MQYEGEIITYFYYMIRAIINYMKYLLLILLTAIIFSSVAQQPKPAGIANTYTHTGADGFPGYNYVTQAQFSASGKIYIKDFFGNFHITGNNFIQ